MIAYDTEDDSKGTPTIINFFNGKDHTTYTGKNLRYRAWSYLNENAPDLIWACNAEYDLINLFGAEWISKLNTLQYVSAGFMQAFFNEAQIKFYDTMRHWPASVETMGKKIGLPKLSMPHLGCTCDGCVEYCRRDTEITWRFTNAMVQRYEDLDIPNVRPTLPSMAMQLFLQFYRKPLGTLPAYVREFIRKAYYGGRVEIFRMGVIKQKIYHYDVNSLYPSVMRGYYYPSIEPYIVKEKPNFEKEGVFEGWVWVPECEYPCLPYRTNGEVIFPTGNLYGSWTYPEIRQLLEDGGTVARCKECLEFDKIEKPFDDYIDFCYQKRLASTGELDSLIWKLFMNSLYGKFASHKGLIIIKNDKETILDSEPRHANVIWSAYCTAYARLKLLKYLRSTSDCFYTDTDSLFTSDILPVSTKLGELKLEGIYKQAEFKGNKLYTMYGNTVEEMEQGKKPKTTTRAKGVPRAHQEVFFKTGKAVYSKPTRYRESRVVPDRVANYWKEVSKESHKEYSKRVILNNNLTEAWNIDKYKKSLES